MGLLLTDLGGPLLSLQGGPGTDPPPRGRRAGSLVSTRDHPSRPHRPGEQLLALGGTCPVSEVRVKCRVLGDPDMGTSIGNTSGDGVHTSAAPAATRVWVVDGFSLSAWP